MKPQILEALVEARSAGRAAALVTDLATGAQALLVEARELGDLTLDDEARAAIAAASKADRSGVAEIGGRSLFIHIHSAPLRLIVVGAVHIAQPLVPMAGLAGYGVTVVDPRRAFATDERFPDVTVLRDWPDEALAALAPDARTAVVTLTHDPKLDDPALDAALRTDAFYIAALGSRKTHAARLERLAQRGHGADALGRIHGPAGLSIGAVSPAEIAISIMAQMTTALRGGKERRP